MRAASQAGREHPCRVLAVIAREARASSRLDAEIRSGEGAPGQTVLLRLYGPMGEHADSVIMPLLVPDTPVVTWWHGLIPAVPSAQPLGVIAQRRVTDAARARAPAEALAALSAGYQPGDTDLSWTRATPWRSLLAAIVDQELDAIYGGAVAAEEHNPTADLLAAWLSSRLHVPFSREVSGGPGHHRGALQHSRGRGHHLQAGRPGRDADQARPARPACGAAAQGHCRTAGRGAAPPGSRRGLRRGARLGSQNDPGSERVTANVPVGLAAPYSMLTRFARQSARPAH